MKKLSLIVIVNCLSFISCIAQGTWTQKANFPGTARYDAMSFEIGSKGYIIGGFDGGATFLKDVWEYDAVNNSWTQKQDFISTRWMAVSFSIGTKGYVTTGSNSSAYYNDLWEYNPTTDTWTQKANLPTLGRNAAVGFSIGNKAYLGIGYDINSTVMLDFWEYDAVPNSWAQKANFSGGKRSFAFGLSIGTKGYIGTGIDSSNIPMDDFWEYDPALDTWVQKAKFAAGKRKDIDGAHFIIGNYGYVGTGYDPPNLIYYNDFWKYDPSNDSWTQIPNLSASVKVGASGFSINNKGYICLGVIFSANPFNDLWEYSPDSTSGIEEIKNKNVPFLGDAQPNPNNGSTQIPYYLPDGTSNAKIIFTDMLGKIMKEEALKSGYGIINVNTQELPNGVYNYSLIIDGKVIDNKKMICNK